MNTPPHQMVTTADGSNTLYHAGVGEHYHSVNGALAESRHVFLQSGLQFFLSQNRHAEAAVLEVGFGTGLNFLLTADDCEMKGIRLDYTGVEAFPLDHAFIQQTGHAAFVHKKTAEEFYEKYTGALTGEVSIGEYCRLNIQCGTWPGVLLPQRYDVVYFDAFAAQKQPGMWEYSSIKKAADAVKPGGIFVTYAITGNLKRQFKAMGFKVEKAPGAPGKREMLRATRVRLQL